MSIHPSFLRPDLPTTEPIRGKTYRADGWAYIEMMHVKTPITWFDEIEAVAGEGHLVYISKYAFPDGTGAAMFMLSPEGQERVVAFTSRRRETPGEERTLQ